MAETRNEAAVRSLLDAWNRNDWEALERSYAADAIVVAPEGWPESETQRGWPGIRSQFERLKDSWSKEQFELATVELAGDVVLVSGRWRARGAESGIDLDLPMWMLIALKDGIAQHVEFYLDGTRLEAASTTRRVKRASEV